jgi:hypothetical protein
VARHDEAVNLQNPVWVQLRCNKPTTTTEKSSISLARNNFSRLVQQNKMQNKVHKKNPSVIWFVVAIAGFYLCRAALAPNADAVL